MNVKDQVKLFKNIIKNEYSHIQDTEAEDIEKAYVEYGEYTEKKVNIIEQLKDLLSDEVFNLVNELEEINLNISCLEQRHYFKAGVKAGISNLNFLSEYDTKMLL